jgi:hypothetical protein
VFVFPPTSLSNSFLVPSCVKAKCKQQWLE